MYIWILISKKKKYLFVIKNYAKLYSATCKNFVCVQICTFLRTTWFQRQTNPKQITNLIMLNIELSATTAVERTDGMCCDCNHLRHKHKHSHTRTHEPNLVPRWPRQRQTNAQRLEMNEIVDYLYGCQLGC